MTAQQLQRNYEVKKEVDKLYKQLEELERKAKTQAEYPTPYSKNYTKRIEKLTAEYYDKFIIWLDNTIEIEKEICKIPDCLIRIILSMRYTWGCSWRDIARTARSSEKAVKMRCVRYLKTLEV